MWARNIVSINTHGFGQQGTLQTPFHTEYNTIIGITRFLTATRNLVVSGRRYKEGQSLHNQGVLAEYGDQIFDPKNE